MQSSTTVASLVSNSKVTVWAESPPSNFHQKCFGSSGTAIKSTHLILSQMKQLSLYHFHSVKLRFMLTFQNFPLLEKSASVKCGLSIHFTSAFIQLVKH